MTADQILAARHYSQIFKSRERLKQDYINLCKVYHPDLHSNNDMASEIMSKINVLYEQAQKTHDLITFKGKELIAASWISVLVSLFIIFSEFRYLRISLRNIL